MNIRRARTCREDFGSGKEPGPARPLSDFRESSYVLLGEPGAGKTTCFEMECNEAGGQPLTAREFSRRIKESWRGQVLYLDGLDEMRAGGGDRRLPLETLCDQLEELGRPRFRLSCREADWLESVDQDKLQSVAPNGLHILRLQPLTEDSQKAMVEAHTDWGEFKAGARRVGMTELLGNPQQLKLLLQALGNAPWPEDRREIYERACRKLVAEHNPEHQEVRAGHLPTDENLLDAAGFLALICLLGNLAGFALMQKAVDEDFPAVQNLESSLPLLPALKSMLFRQAGADRRMPEHRSSAEYMAARYLVKQLNGSPALRWRRLLALLSGHDGKPPTGLRGLWAWLSSLLTGPQRREMARTDPVSVLLFGDVRPWPAEEKKELLMATRREAEVYPWVLHGNWDLSPLGALATPDMGSAFKEILAAPEGEKAQQTLAYCVVEALNSGDILPEMEDSLESLVRDATRSLLVRKVALQAWQRQYEARPDRPLRFLALLDEIHRGKVDDADDELLGLLLHQLYPLWIPPGTLPDYLHEPKSARTSSYFYYWHWQLLKLIPDAHIPLLLDALVAKPRTDEHASVFDLRDGLIGKLLEAGLRKHGISIAPDRLYDWLSLGLDKHGFCRIRNDAKPIGAWLSEHPELVRAILAESIKRAPNEPKSWFYHQWYVRLYGAPWPQNLGTWILDQLPSVERPAVAAALFQEAVRLANPQPDTRGTDLSLDDVHTWTADHPAFQPILDEMLRPQVFPELEKLHQEQEEYRLREAARKAEWIEHVHQYLPSLRAGDAPVGLLDQLGEAYFGHFIDAKGDAPLERLQSLLQDNVNPTRTDELVQASLTAFRLCLEKTDLPNLEEIIGVSLKNQHHLIGTPCLAGTEELYGADVTAFLALDDAILGRLLAWQYTLGHGRNPDWFIALKLGRPDLVASVFIAYTSATLKAKRSCASDVWAVAHNDEYEAVARLAVPALFQAFPLRAPKPLFSDLEELLKAGLKYLAPQELLALIRQRLSAKGMEAGQRTLWLLTGLVLAPTEFREALKKHVGKSQARAEQVSSFFPGVGDAESPMPADVETLAWLIDLLGPHSSTALANGLVTPPMAMADRVRRFISRLGAVTSPEAAAALKDLSEKPSLAHWSNHLKDALHAQSRLMRDATFRPPSLSEILHTLNNRQPANAADLWALTLANLESLAKEIRDGSNNSARKFWSLDDANQRPLRPKPENDCRDMLMELLERDLAHQQVSVERERYYVEDKRADIAVSFGIWRIAVEIKRNSHRDWWRAIRDQLDQYRHDPRCDGYAIYLLLWFGEGYTNGKPPDGRKPLTAEKAVQQLLAQVPERDRQQIGVCVIDCSLPHAKK